VVNLAQRYPQPQTESLVPPPLPPRLSSLRRNPPKQPELKSYQMSASLPRQRRQKKPNLAPGQDNKLSDSMQNLSFSDKVTIIFTNFYKGLLMNIFYPYYRNFYLKEFNLQVFVLFQDNHFVIASNIASYQ